MHSKAPSRSCRGEPPRPELAHRRAHRPPRPGARAPQPLDPAPSVHPFAPAPPRPRARSYTVPLLIIIFFWNARSIAGFIAGGVRGAFDSTGVSMPDVQMPSMPSVQMPQVELPSFGGSDAATTAATTAAEAPAAAPVEYMDAGAYMDAAAVPPPAE